jgi:hypothetical protein
MCLRKSEIHRLIPVHSYLSSGLNPACSKCLVFESAHLGEELGGEDADVGLLWPSRIYVPEASSASSGWSF